MAHKTTDKEFTLGLSLVSKKIKKRKSYTRTEGTEQEKFVKWFRFQFPKIVLASFPNDSRCTAKEGARLKCMGMTKGMPDIAIFWPVNDLHVFFIKFTRKADGIKKAGRSSKEQIEIAKQLVAAGYLVRICYTFQEAKDLVLDYFAGHIR